VGIVAGEAALDLNYVEDKDAAVDLNVVMTDDGQFVEVQGAGEESTFTHEQFLAMLELGKKGVGDLLAAQRAVLEARGE
jgi:ribonuclease PH